MARLQIVELPEAVASPGFLLIIDMVDAANLTEWRGDVGQLKADTGAVGVIVTNDRLDVAGPP